MKYVKFHFADRSKCLARLESTVVTDRKHSYSITENNQNISLDYTDTIKDLGVLMNEKLTFIDHIHDKVNKAYAMLGIIKRNFKYVSIPSFILLYKTMVRSQLIYCSYKKVILRYQRKYNSEQQNQFMTTKFDL